MIEALKAVNLEPEGRPGRRQGGGRPEWQHGRVAADRLRRPQRVRLHHQGEVADGRDLSKIDGLTYRNLRGRGGPQPGARHPRGTWIALPFVSLVYHRDLVIEDYFIGYLKHPYLSIYTGRGCKSRCTFCLWPETVGGHRYRTRSVGHVIDEIPLGEAQTMPEIRARSSSSIRLHLHRRRTPRAEAIARELGKLGVTWSCNAKANVPREHLEGDARQRPCGCC